jgi:hypothetical protein
MLLPQSAIITALSAKVDLFTEKDQNKKKLPS